MVKRQHFLPAIVFTLFAFGASGIARADMGDIHVDIPVKLKEAKVVFNMDHFAVAGDMPIGMRYMHLLSKRLQSQGVKANLIGIFHGPTAYMMLNDAAYDKARHVMSGNPYKTLIAGLIKDGVQIEECAVSMAGNNWTNADLLPGVKVNSGAVGRLVELSQEGYVQIQP